MINTWSCQSNAILIHCSITYSLRVIRFHIGCRIWEGPKSCSKLMTANKSLSSHMFFSPKSPACPPENTSSRQPSLFRFSNGTNFGFKNKVIFNWPYAAASLSFKTMASQMNRRKTISRLSVERDIGGWERGREWHGHHCDRLVKYSYHTLLISLRSILEGNLNICIGSKVWIPLNPLWQNANPLCTFVS